MLQIQISTTILQTDIISTNEQLINAVTQMCRNIGIQYLSERETATERERKREREFWGG